MAIAKSIWRDAALTGPDHIKVALDAVVVHTDLTSAVVQQMCVGTVDLGAEDSIEIAERASRAHANVQQLATEDLTECRDAMAALELFQPPRERTRINAGIATLKGPTS